MTVMAEPQPFDFRAAGSLSPSQVRVFDRVAGTFAAEAGFRLATQLRRDVAFEPAGVEEVAGLGGAPGAGFVRFPLCIGENDRGGLRLEATAALQLVDLRLGQKNLAEPDPNRRLTDLEMRILRVIVAELVRDVERAWGPLGDLPIRLEEESDEESTQPDVGGSAVAMAWAITLEGVRSRMEMLLPSALIGRLLPAQRQAAQPARSTSGPSRERLRRIPLKLRARTDETTLSLGDLHLLQPGDLLGLEIHLEQPTRLEVNGTALFTGRLVTAAGRRAIRIEQEAAEPVRQP